MSGRQTPEDSGSQSKHVRSLGIW